MSHLRINVTVLGHDIYFLVISQLSTQMKLVIAKFPSWCRGNERS